MALSDLVQVGDDLWVDPKDIKGVKFFAANRLGPDMPVEANATITHYNGRYSISHWPRERVLTALRLHDVTWIHELWEATA